jgi:hypothetical protein
LVAVEWSVFHERADVPLEHLADGREWRVSEALLTLHAIADEACAVQAAAPAGAPPSDALMTAAGEDRSDERTLDRVVDARCSRCSKNDGPRTQTKPGIPSDACGPSGLADGQTGI